MLCLVAALPAEARPLIDHYKLKSLDGHPHRLYAGDDCRLIVSGIGKIAAAAAVAYQQAQLNDTAAWLNIGVAGHARAPIGTALGAHKVVDVATGKSFYPVFTNSPYCPTTLVHTVDRPESAYETDCAYDMEASGFTETALRYASGELVHCLKVVSDNPQASWRDLDAKKVEQLIGDKMDAITTVGKTLADLARDQAALHAVPPEFDDLVSRWRFTATQRHRLYGLLQRWQTLAPDQAILDDVETSSTTRDDVLAVLEKQLRELELNLV